jgi:hypothetical protein
MMLEDMVNDLPVNDQIEEISKLATRQLKIESEIAKIENILLVAKSEYMKLTERLIPDAMASIGITEITLENGMKLSIKSDIHAGIRKDFTDEALDWLENNGLGGIIKNEVDVKFGKGDNEKVAVLLSFCNQAGFPAKQNMSVHAGTLKATIKEQLAKGVEFPDDLFSVFNQKKSIIKAK